MGASARALAGRRVLVVEDEYVVAEEMAVTFREGGAEVIGPVGSLDAALDLLATGQPIDGAVLDINLQGAMVYPLADLLKRDGIRFVFATGYEAEHVPARFSEIVRLQKPVAPGRIVHALFG